jgi:exonuclease SbcC
VRLKSCHFRNIGPFVDWTIDFSRYRDDQKLFAFVAVNGTGKSSACELSMLGAAYLNTPTQGTPAKRATASDTLLESVIVHGGHEWTLRHLLDGVNGGGHSVVLKDGELLLKKAGPTQFKAWAELHLPPRSVVEASLFRYQKSEGFVEMEPTDRMSVLLRVIGAERLERKAALAREKAKEEKKKLDELLRQIAEVRGNDAGVEANELALAAAVEASAGADVAVTGAKEALAALQQLAADHAVKKTAREAAEKLRTTLEQQGKSAAARRADCELKIAGNRQFQAEAEQIRAAAARLESENATLTRLELALAESDKAIRAELDPWRDGSARLKAVEQRRAAAQARLKDEAAVRQAVTDKAALAAAVEAEKVAVAALDEERAALEAKGWAGDKERASDLRAGMQTASEQQTYESTHQVLHDGLDKDDAVLRDATETPKQLAELKTRLASERAHLAEAERKLSAAERLAARAPDLESAQTDRDGAAKEAGELLQGHALAVLTSVALALGRVDTAGAARQTADALAVTRKLAGRLAALEDSGRRIGELEALLAAAQAEETTAAAEVAKIVLEEAGEAPVLASAVAALASAEQSAADAKAAVTKAEMALLRSRETEAKLEGKLVERAGVEAELADWTRLALDHGRNGLQSDVVDAAGPELTTYINGCLRSCVGTRWTVTVETQQLDAKGKELVDKLTIMVIDNKRGTRREVKLHSGGERTTLAEAIASGLTMLGCKRAGFDRPTLVRDESANFLDHESAPLWVKMMRHVVEFTNADRLLFVSHNPAVVRLADVTIEVPDQGAQQQTENPQAA